MINFNTYLFTESAAPQHNLHLEHLEDEVFNGGVVGGRRAITFLLSLHKMLTGHTTEHLNITTKWDGAPAIFCGINPDNHRFFVGTKGVFAKTAKLNYTSEDIDRNHASEGLREKLKIALEHLPKLGITGILQGDMLFTHADLKKETIDAESYLVFQPNTIVYAVPYDSLLAAHMRAAKLGVVFHTSYHGPSMDKMKASFKVDIGALRHTADVWYRDASFVDQSGTANFTEEESARLGDLLAVAGRVFQVIDAKVLNRISLNATLLGQIKQYNNTFIRSGKVQPTAKDHVLGLTRWVEQQANADILDAKLPKTKQNRLAAKNELLHFYRGSYAELVKIFLLTNLLNTAKLQIIRKLETAKSIGTFLKTEDGYRVTGVEGFVAIDHLKGGVVKLVDRLKFSQANFNAVKNWDK